MNNQLCLLIVLSVGIFIYIFVVLLKSKLQYIQAGRVSKGQSET